jgi:hypothetical protein
MAVKTTPKGSGSQNESNQAPGGQQGDGGSGDGDGGGSDDGNPPEGGAGDENKGGDSLDESKLDEATKNYIRKLRNESAKYRTRANQSKQELDDTKKRLSKLAGGEDDEAPPEQVIEALSTRSAVAEFDNAILTLAVENNITKEGLSYFRFLVNEQAGQLEEGEELDEEVLATIAKQVRKVHGQASGQNNSSAGTGANGGGQPPKPGADGGVTLDKFCQMGVLQKSKLYQDNPELYTRLVDEARANKRLV